MKIEETGIKGLVVITPEVFNDDRGYFMETYSYRKLEEAFQTKFVQDNQSFSKGKGVIRGLHCQVYPHCQTKLIRCTEGEIIDYVVDLRADSDTYLKHFEVKLTSENKKMLYIPQGFLHGFKTLTDNVTIQYKVDDYYSKECDRSIKYNDPVFEIDWDVENPILSNKDLNAPLLKDSDVNFK